MANVVINFAAATLDELKEAIALTKGTSEGITITGATFKAEEGVKVADEVSKKRSEKVQKIVEDDDKEIKSSFGDDESDASGETKPANRAQYAKLPDGSVIHVEKGEQIPVSPKDAGWKKATKAEFEAYQAIQAGEDDAQSDDSDVVLMAIDPKGDISLAQFREIAMAFSKNDTHKERGNALIKHYGVDSLKELDPSYYGDIVDLIQRSAKHFKTRIDEIPTDKNKVLIKKINDLPVEPDDEDDDF
jgi:hypothetical protein